MVIKREMKTIYVEYFYYFCLSIIYIEILTPNTYYAFVLYASFRSIVTLYCFFINEVGE